MVLLALFLYAQLIALHHFCSSALPFNFYFKNCWELMRVFSPELSPCDNDYAYNTGYLDFRCCPSPPMLKQSLG